ncbi:MAG: S9 family peptidase [Acidobacteria bacterium]|nr:S9 family peptidase [Acidobacteriota bacterium]
MERKRRITPLDLIGLRLPAGLSAAPSGDRVAFTLTDADLAKSELHSQVHVAPSEPPTPENGLQDRPLTFGLYDAEQPAWSPDGRWLAFVTFRPQPHEDEEDDQTEEGIDKRQVFVLANDGGEARRLTEAAEGVDLYRWWPDGTGVVFLGPAPRPAAERGWRRRRRDNRDDGIVVHGDLPEWEIWFQPLEGKARRLLGGQKGVQDFDVSPDGKWLAYSTDHTGRPEDADKTEVILRDLESGAERRLTKGRGGAEGLPRFTPDGRWLLFHGWADPQIAFSRQELFAVDLSGEPAAPRPLLDGVDRDLEEFVVLPDGRVAAVVAWGFECRLVLVDPASGRWEMSPLEGKLLACLSAARGSGRLAAIVEDATSTPEIAWVDPASGALELLTDLNPETEEWRRARRTRVAWDNDGLRHEGLLLLPEPGNGAAAGEPPPVLVWIHGGPHWRTVDTLRIYEAEALAGLGWAVFMPQYRGSAGYAQSYALALKGDLGGGDARDIVAGLDHLGRLGLVDTTRAAAAGASYGAYLTNWLLATTKRFRAGVSVCGIFDLAQDFSTSEFYAWEVHYLGGPPWEKAELYHERSPLTHAASIDAPVLILHGLEDDNTFVTNSKALYRALTALGRTAELVIYPREGHGLIEPAHRADAHQRMVDWLSRHVLGREAAHVPGREVGANGVRLIPLGHQVRRDYAGVRPPEGRTFLEVTLLLRAVEGGPDALRLVPAGAGADLVLVDERGDLFRPVGVPVDVLGQPVLFSGRGALEAWQEDGRPPALPAAAVFEIPDEPALYRLQVTGLPAVVLDVTPRPDPADDEEPPR